ncbi:MULTISPECIES: DsbA family protein [unclassified Corynebacterium]|uniref:DsbA family protein n=1 Tax=unclassified Corynebacterium TaxID=2624378 RepID=UPI003523F4D4
MSTKIKSPNEKGHGFLWALLAVLGVAVLVIGYIVISGNQEEPVEIEPVAFTVNHEDGYIALASDSAGSDTPTVDLYEDYSCPHCAELAEATDGDMKQAITDGELIVNIHPLSFVSAGDGKHSTLAGTAALTVAESGDAEVYWNFRTLLMDEQAKIFGKWDYNNFADAALKVGANEETVAKIRSGAEQERFDEIAAENAEKLKAQTGRVSSPRIIRDGEDVPLENWVATVTG